MASQAERVRRELTRRLSLRQAWSAVYVAAERYANEHPEDPAWFAVLQAAFPIVDEAPLAENDRRDRAVAALKVETSDDW